MSFFRTLGTPRQPLPRELSRTVRMGGRDVPLEVRSHPRAKRLTLRVAPGGGLRLTVPPRIARGEVDAFLERHEGWAVERLSRLPERAVIGVGTVIPVAGEPHEVVHSGSLRGVTRRENASLVVSGPEERAGARAREWLKKEARRALDPLVRDYAARVGRPVRAVRVKDTRSRWGSCTHDGSLSFSWRLAMAPPFVLDALAAHEVAHLVHMNHGEAFWALARSLCGETDEARAWLRREGPGLQAWRFDPEGERP